MTMVCSLDHTTTTTTTNISNENSNNSTLIAPIADHHLLIPIPMRIPQEKSKIMSLERKKGESIVIPIWVVELVKTKNQM